MPKESTLMPEVVALKVACFIIPFIAMFGSLIEGGNIFFGFALGLGISAGLFITATIGWHIEDTKNNKKFSKEQAAALNAVEKS